jgi:hypothetical protein
MGETFALICRHALNVSSAERDAESGPDFPASWNISEL